MRLIDADELKNAIIHHLAIRSENYLLESERGIYNLIDKQPTVELLKEQQQEVERLKAEHGKVIRCKECKYFQEGNDINGKHFTRCNCEKRTPTLTWGASVTPDWFCGHAEAKDGEQE